MPNTPDQHPSSAVTTAIVQMAAFFIQQSGGSLPMSCLPPLLYLSERTALKTHGHFISFDTFVALPHGPALAGTEQMALDGEGYNIRISRPYSREALEDLRDEDIVVLQGVHDKFSGVELWALRKYTQTQCSEWSATKGEYHISDLALAKAVGYAPEAATELCARLATQRGLIRQLAA
jgi:Protein of unknown function (DUF4065)